MPLWVGLDVHKQSCHATVLDERGEVVLQKRVPNEPEVLEELFGAFSGYCLTHHLPCFLEAALFIPPI
jgi:transposase